MNACRPGGHGPDRAQSEVLSVVLLLAITIAGATTIIVFGATAVSQVEQSVTSGAAEQSMAQLDSRASLVAHGDSDTQRLTLSGTDDATTRVDANAGWINITVRNVTTGAVETVILNQSLGAVVYADGSDTIAYQGGGVWRSSGNGSVMVSPPEFHYKGRTLTLPLVVVDGQGTVSDTVQISQNGTVQSKYPNPSLGRLNPLSSGQVVVTVKSEYYEAWGRFFVQRTAGNATINHSRETARVVLVTPTSNTAVSGGVVSDNNGGTLTLQNNNAIDSYNSSDGPYAISNTPNTTVVTSGDVVLQNLATLKGDLVSGGSVSMQNNAEVTGNVSHTTGFSKTGAASVGGWVAPNASVDTPGDIGPVIDQRLATVQSTNDNGPAPAVDDSTDRLQGCASTCELGAGQYYLSEVALGTGDTLELNTSGGPITIVVDGNFKVSGQGTINVVGGGVARIYVDQDLTIQDQANVSVPGQRSPQLWLYVDSGHTATIKNNARLVGVVYGPGGSTPGADIEIENNVEVFGALVGDVDDVPNNADIHFDEALLNQQALPTGTSVPRITYLHVSVTHVNVTATGG